MRRLLRRAALAVVVLVVLALAGGAWWWHAKLPRREGTLALAGLKAPVVVRWDEAGVPHLRAEHEADLYRALGYLHAQDRLFQMEILRRLARGELAEILGPKLVETDRLFRTLGIRAHADAYAARLDPARPATRALAAYLDGVNQYQATRPAPLEFDVLGIPKRPFTAADTVSIAGYLAYSFAAGLRTDPVLTQVRDRLGADYLRIFDLSGGAGARLASVGPREEQVLARLAQASSEALALAGVPSFEGSNAWAVAGARTASGKPLLAGDPHIAYAVPAVWWEAHLAMPGFELYGHFQALNPMALLGVGPRHAWSLTMFQNDDLDLVAEMTDPADANRVLDRGVWVTLATRRETIAVKGASPVELVLRRSPHGPIVNDAIGGAEVVGTAPIAMWWAFLETENPVLDAFYELNRADSLAAARAAASKIHAPGLNVVWANAQGDIAWWAAAKLPVRPAGVEPAFVLDAARGEADKPGFLPFEANPQEENPARGYIVSANHRPARGDVPGYYNLWDRAQRLDSRLADADVKWSPANTPALQLDAGGGYPARIVAPLAAVLRAVAKDDGERALVERLVSWDGEHRVDAIEPTLFNQFAYELAREAMADELGEPAFKLLLRTRALDHALPRLAADAASPWWDRRDTPEREGREATVAAAWQASLAHLRRLYGIDTAQWSWGRAHTVTHGHALGQQPPLHLLFNVGPFAAPGGHETPNNLSGPRGPAPWAVTYGPSTRRIVDLADTSKALGSNPVGQSGVWGDAHYADQATAHHAGSYRPQHQAEADVAAHTRSTLRLEPAPRP